MPKPSLRAALNDGRFVAAPGIPDMIAAQIANKIGFEFVYASGFWSVASAYGLPDAGIATYTEMVARVSILCRTSNSAVIADADTGYGGLINVHHTVRGYEEAGVRGIQIEDQQFPKRCGHTPVIGVIEKEEAVDKIRVACEARRNPEETLIIARTDAMQAEGLEKAIARGQAYAEAGADIVFVEALRTEEAMRTACAEIATPMMANMADGGHTPIMPTEKLAEIGYSAAIFPAMVALAQAAAAQKALLNFKATGTSLSPDVDLFDFKEMQTLVGFPEVWELEERWEANKIAR